MAQSVFVSPFQAYHRVLDKTVHICVMSTKDKWPLVYLFVSLFLFYLVPVLLLFVQYTRIVLTIKKRNLKHHLISINSGSTTNTAHAAVESASTAPSKQPTAKRENHHGNDQDAKSLKQGLLACESTYSPKAMSSSRDDVTEKFSISQTRSPSLASKFSNANTRAPSGTIGEGQDRMSNRRSTKTKAVNVKAVEIKMPHINQKQIITLLIVMVLLCFVCLLPYRLFSLWTATASKEDLSRLGLVNYYNLLIFSRVAFYLNSALNPIFYHIISTKFQNAFKKFFSSSSRRSSAVNQFAAANHTIKQRRSTLALANAGKEKGSNPTPPVSQASAANLGGHVVNAQVKPSNHQVKIPKQAFDDHKRLSIVLNGQQNN